MYQIATGMGWNKDIKIFQNGSPGLWCNWPVGKVSSHDDQGIVALLPWLSAYCWKTLYFSALH